MSAAVMYKGALSVPQDGHGMGGRADSTVGQHRGYACRRHHAE